MSICCEPSRLVLRLSEKTIDNSRCCKMTDWRSLLGNQVIFFDIAVVEFETRVEVVIQHDEVAVVPQCLFHCKYVLSFFSKPPIIS